MFGEDFTLRQELQCVTNLTIQMKATEQYFHVVLFIMPCKPIPTLKFVENLGLHIYKIKLKLKLSRNS